MVWKYPDEIEDFVREHSKKLRDDDLAELVNKTFGTSFTKGSIKAYRGNHGIRNGKKQWTSEEYWKYQKRYPRGMYEFVRDSSWGVSSKAMAAMVNEKFGTSFTATMMKQFRQRHGIKSGVTGWYQKGHPPGTKGKTQWEICKGDPDKLARIKATQYKKGDRPVNEMQVGAIVRNTDGYLLKKISMQGGIWDRWKPLHRLVWEEANGPIPEGYVVTFRDNDRMNCSLDNLMLITRGENAAMNRMHLKFSNPEATDAGLSVVRLNNAVKKKRKKA